jgi:hypothetical protein
MHLQDPAADHRRDLPVAQSSHVNHSRRDLPPSMGTGSISNMRIISKDTG